MGARRRVLAIRVVGRTTAAVSAAVLGSARPGLPQRHLRLGNSARQTNQLHPAHSVRKILKNRSRRRNIAVAVLAVLAAAVAVMVALPSEATVINPFVFPGQGTIVITVTTVPAGEYDPRTVLLELADDSTYLCDSGSCTNSVMRTPEEPAGTVFDLMMGENDGGALLSNPSAFSSVQGASGDWIFQRQPNPFGFNYTVRLAFEPSGATPTPTATTSATPTASTSVTPTQTPTAALKPLMAGTFIQVRGAPPDYPPSGEACTAGFAVLRGADSWMLTAQHCLAGNAIVNVWRATKPSMTTLYASRISCGAGLLLGCVPGRYQPVALPDEGQEVRSWPSGDYFAWRPDPGQYAAQPIVITGKGSLPVVGYADLRAGDKVCHYGQGSGGEQCGHYQSTEPNGWYGVKIKRAIGGDSGGPAYTYVTDAYGKAVGVKAVGLVEVDFYANDKGKAKAGMSVAPIRLIERELGVTLLTGR